MDIALALREAQQANGWSIAKIADEGGVIEGTARKYLSGERIPRGDFLMKLRRALPGFAELLDRQAVA